jgi:hypothetical protein
MASGNPAWRRVAAERIQDHHRTELAPLLFDLLKSPDAGVRRDAAETLGFIGYEIPNNAGQALSLLLQDESAEVREEVVVALWRLAYADAVPGLQRAMCFDKDAAVRLAIARRLSALDDPAYSQRREGAKFPECGSEAIFQYALNDPDPWVRANAAAGLGFGRNRSSRVRLEAVLAADRQGGIARAGYLCGLWLLDGGQQILEEFLRMGRDGELISEMCQWIHRALDLNLVGDAAMRRIRMAWRNQPEAGGVVERIALWQGERMMERARAAEDRDGGGGHEG